MDPDGDMLLRIGSEVNEPTSDFIVCSASLRRASPVWKAMLFGPWLESKPVVHSKFEMIPMYSEMTETLLVNTLSA